MSNLKDNNDSLQSILEKIKGLPDSNYNDWIEEGKQIQYNWFWDNYSPTTCNGQFMFAGKGWNDETFKPPIGIVIKPTYPYMMFAGTGITDLVALCEERNITIDFSETTTTQYIFYNGSSALITHVGVIDIRKCDRVMNMINGTAKLETVDNLILRDDGSQTFTTPIEGCTSLKNLTITGKIGQDGMRLNSCPLTHDSLMSVINALYDYSGTTTTRTITLGTTNINKLTEAEKAIATQKGWSLV